MASAVARRLGARSRLIAVEQVIWQDLMTGRGRGRLGSYRHPLGSKRIAGRGRGVSAAVGRCREEPPEAVIGNPVTLAAKLAGKGCLAQPFTASPSLSKKACCGSKEIPVVALGLMTGGITGAG